MWAVKDGSGRIVSSFGSRLRLELANKLIGERYDAFRLQVSSSYRQLFEPGSNEDLSSRELADCEDRSAQESASVAARRCSCRA